MPKTALSGRAQDCAGVCPTSASLVGLPRATQRRVAAREASRAQASAFSAFVRRACRESLNKMPDGASASDAGPFARLTSRNWRQTHASLQ